MVGDGVNDAAALAAAAVGAAMHAGGMGAAESAASVVMMRGNLWQLADAIDLSRATFRKIELNLAWAFGYNLVALPLASGMLVPRFRLALTPAMAGALMGASSLGVMLNSLSLAPLYALHAQRAQDAHEAVSKLLASVERGSRSPVASLASREVK